MEMKWICRECGFVYDGEDFSLENNDYTCPLCERGKEVFEHRAYEHEVKTALEEAIEVQDGKGN